MTKPARPTFSHSIVLALAAVVACALGTAGAQTPGSGTNKVQLTNPTVVQADYVAVSKALRDIAAKAPAAGLQQAEPLRGVRINPSVKPKVAGDAAGAAIDAVLQGFVGVANMPAPNFTFDGATVHGCNCAPPDPNGDVGPHHYVQQVNVRMRVYDKTTAALVAGPVKLSQLFASAGLTDTCATSDDGDPIVLYDQFADRWLISQFAVGQQPNRECVAVSNTGPDRPVVRLFVRLADRDLLSRLSQARGVAGRLLHDDERVQLRGHGVSRRGGVRVRAREDAPW